MYVKMIILNDIKIKFTDDVLNTMRKYIQWKKMETVTTNTASEQI